MKQLILCFVGGLALVISGRAQTMQVPVAPGQMEYSNFIFSVTTMATNGGKAFHVTITTKNNPIQSDCAATLSAVSGTATIPVITGLNPSVPIILQRMPRVWTADFVASPDVMNNPSAYFIFVVPDYTTDENGRRTYLSTDRMYEMRLQDF